MKYLASGITIVALLVALQSASAQTHTQTSSVLDGSGGRSAGGGYQHIGAGGQPGGISVSSSGDLVNYAGFLGTFSLRPDLDTDQDGLEDELDPDNDGDALDDATEISGTAFKPNTPTQVNDPDSDQDGAHDGDEAAAGTNPMDAGSLLRISGVDYDALFDTLGVAWHARGGRAYKVYRVDDLMSDWPGILLGRVTATGGSAPWFETTASYDDSSAGGAESYYIEVDR